MLASMTGYARAVSVIPGATFACEVNSVNGRGLDLRLRLPPGFDQIEGNLRQMAGKALSRGSITINVSVERDGAVGEVFVNQLALAMVLEALESLSGQPRLISVRSSTALRLMSPAHANWSGAAVPWVAGSISCHRNLTGKPIRYAPSPMPWN